MAILDKEKRVKKELNKLKKILSDIEEDKKKATEQLINNAAWMAVSLEDIRAEIDLTGYVEEYQNGENQSGKKESSLVRTYNSLIKNYNSTIKLILDNIDIGNDKTDDKLAQFLMKK